MKKHLAGIALILFHMILIPLILIYEKGLAGEYRWVLNLYGPALIITSILGLYGLRYELTLWPSTKRAVSMAFLCFLLMGITNTLF